MIGDSEIGFGLQLENASIPFVYANWGWVYKQKYPEQITAWPFN